MRGIEESSVRSWLWCARLGDQTDGPLAYALLAPVSGTPGQLCVDQVSLAGDARLSIYHGVIGDEARSAILKRLAAGSIDLSPAGVPMTLVPVKSWRETLEVMLGDPAASVTAHHSLPDPAMLAAAAGGLDGLLGKLEEHLGLPFREHYRLHLGALDVVTFGNDPPEAAIATGIEGDPPRLVVRRRPPLADVDQWLHLTARIHDETLEDILLPLPANTEIVEHPVTPDVGSFDVRIFPAAGGRRQFVERANLVRRVDINGRMTGQEVRLDDPLTTRLASAPRAVREHAAQRTGYSSFSSETQINDGQIDAQLEKLAAQLAAEAPGCVDRFFDRTLADEVGVIDHLNALLDGGRIRRAVIVDPFFGEAAFLRLVMRLESHDLDLAVVTSWGVTDSDTAERLPLAASVALDENVRRLRALMDRVRPLIAPRLSVRNLVSGADAAFHDRYLLLHPRVGRPTIYLLSNSINNMAANWPFCMTAIGGPAGERAAAYVEGLAAGQDITGGVQPLTNFLWPDPP